ncbi:unnamed protein product [Schistosoma margrebowiei]|uniref:Uncharacterized protein n=1 Tax=Schistosoma margrebowiei TaxID=48269 RepID=A0A183N3T1_9TREM|nr:unnamed protein product [Schistosoma margrebowiei]
MQCDVCKGWYHEVCTNLTPAAFKRFSKKGCVWLCQQCCSDANSLLTEDISVVDAAKKCFSKYSRNASNSTRSDDTQINVKETKVSPVIDNSRPSKKEKQSPKRPALNKNSRKVGPSVPRLPDGIQQETPRSRNRKVRSVSSGKHNATPQVVDNPPKSNTRFDATVIASTSTVDERVKVVRKKSRDIKGNPAPVKVIEKSKADHSDRSVIFHRIKENESSGPKARFEHDIVLISLLNKRSELGVQIDSTKPDIIAVTETWLTQAVDSMEIDFEGFTLVRADRTQKRKGGKLALFIRNAIPFAVIDSVSHESGTCELVSIRLKCKGQDLLIGLVYRSPSCEANEILLSSLNTWSQSGRCLILGDFNAPMVDWENLRTKSSENSFEQELVDGVITCALDDVATLHHMPPIGKSDHDASVQSRPNSSIETAWDAFRNSYLKVRILIRKKRKMWDKFKLLGIDESKSQKLYEEKLLKESIECPKRLYSYINQRTRRKGNIPALWGDSTASSLVEDDFGKAQAFSNYFSNAYTIEAPFSSLDIGKSTGLDELHPRLLKKLSNFVASPLSTYWKNAIVSPVFKTCTKHKPENYRPVSLTSVVKQHGFRIGYSYVAFIDFIWIGGNLLIVRVNSKLSSSETVLSGVPQGTVLGPVLFLLYVNDPPCLLSSSVLLYADDVKIWKTIRCKSDSLELQNDLKKLSEWSKAWQLPINTSKCVVMHIGHQGTDTYTMNNTELPVVQT